MDRVQKIVLLVAVLLPVGIFAVHAVNRQIFVSALGAPHDAKCPDCPGAFQVSDRSTGKVHCHNCGRYLFTMQR